jgi:hypothetical protein
MIQRDTPVRWAGWMGWQKFSFGALQALFLLWLASVTLEAMHVSVLVAQKIEVALMVTALFSCPGRFEVEREIASFDSGSGGTRSSA